MQALDIFMHLIKCKSIFDLTSIDEKNAQLVKVYREKMGQYMQRAEYIKKTVLDKPVEPEAPKGGGGAAAQKKKPKGGDEEDDEEAKLAGGLSQAIITEKPNV